MITCNDESILSYCIIIAAPEMVEPTANDFTEVKRTFQRGWCLSITLNIYSINNNKPEQQAETII